MKSLFCFTLTIVIAVFASGVNADAMADPDYVPLQPDPNYTPLELPGIDEIAVPLGYVDSLGLWYQDNIPVCWEDYDQSNAEDRNTMRISVEGSWERYSAVNFTGWGECRSSSQGIRIKVADVRPNVKVLGSHLDGLANGMVLNTSFVDAVEMRPCASMRVACMQVIAIHEFGHALGFYHEQDREDSSCNDSRKNQKTGIELGAYDDGSIMNYCRPIYNGDHTLSSGDIAAVVEVYPYGRSVREATIARFYNRLFLRTPDKSGMDFYLSVLQSYGCNASTLGWVVRDMVGSAEFSGQDFGRNSTEYRTGVVKHIFRAALNRTATSGDIDFYSDAMIFGLSLHDFTAQVVASTEFSRGAGDWCAL